MEYLYAPKEVQLPCTLSNLALICAVIHFLKQKYLITPQNSFFFFLAIRF